RGRKRELRLAERVRARCGHGAGSRRDRARAQRLLPGSQRALWIPRYVRPRRAHMPVFNVELAKSVIVLKRSMNTGFSGVENELFFLSNTMMVLGDAKKTILSLVNEVRGGGGH